MIHHGHVHMGLGLLAGIGPPKQRQKGTLPEKKKEND